MFQRKESNGLVYFTIPCFNETNQLIHGFTSRIGGVSSQPYESLNLGFTVGDSPSAVLQNRRQIAKTLGFPLEDLVAAKQVHRDKIAIVTYKDKGKGALKYEDAIEDTDALITIEKNLPLSTYYADCVPIFILDTATPAIGLAHAGWKGTALKIGAKTVIKMGMVFGTEKKNLKVAIGPGIGPCCYQVDDRIRTAFLKEFLAAIKYFRNSTPGHWQLNLWEANRDSLMEVGLSEGQIINSKICTACNTELFFSHRKEQGLTGRMAALMMLKTGTETSESDVCYD
ncbi:MAG: peptidoglycan editing factor PgeF [Bacillota bacterium]